MRRRSTFVGIRVASLLAVTLAFAACRGGGGRGPGSARGPEAFDRAAEERGVYAAVLRGMYGEGADLYVVNPSTAVFREYLRGARVRIPEVPADAEADALRSPSRRVPEDLQADRPIAWFGERDFEALEVANPDTIPGMGAWDRFFRKYPKSAGWIQFCSVGFSGDGKRALTHVFRSRGGLSGEGNLVLLERTNGTWRVRKTAQTATA